MRVSQACSNWGSVPVAAAVKSICYILAISVVGQLQGSGILDAHGAPNEPTHAQVEAGLGRRKVSDTFKRAPGGSKIKVAFFDADSTLRVSKSGSVSANAADDVLLLPSVGPGIQRLVDEGYLIAIVSNQNGVAQGHITLQTADRALAYTAELVRKAGGDVHYYDFAEGPGEFRKPDVGMAKKLESILKEKFGDDAEIDKAKSFMVGDSAYKKASPGKVGDLRPDGSPGSHFSNSDRLFAENYGIKFVEPSDFFGWRARGIDVFETSAQVEEFQKRYGDAPCLGLALPVLLGG